MPSRTENEQKCIASLTALVNKHGVIVLFSSWLIANGQASEDELKAIEAEIEKEIDEAVDFAMNSAFPDVAELRRDVFRDEVTA